uniref:Putative par-6 n=1 Tax=Anopheles aquasalis TaxID=42839 RepID=T1DNC7_ANOAQ
MSKSKAAHPKLDSDRVEIKSKFDAEFRRWSVKRSEQHSFEVFQSLIERLHRLDRSQLLVSYIDPRDNDLLPINNDDNFGRALTTARPLLRVIIQKKGDSIENGQVTNDKTA